MKFFRSLFLYLTSFVNKHKQTKVKEFVRDYYADCLIDYIFNKQFINIMSDSSEDEDLSRFREVVDTSFTKLINESRGLPTKDVQDNSKYSL